MALEATVGCHSEERVPRLGTEERLIFGMLEALDWNCPNYGWRCPERRGVWNALRGVSETDLKAFLWDHREVVLAANILPPSFIGLVDGTFDFLKEGDGERTGGV